MWVCGGALAREAPRAYPALIRIHRLIRHRRPMFTTAPEAAPSASHPPEDAAGRVRAFLAERMPALERRMLLEGWKAVEPALDALRRELRAVGLWAPAVPREWGGMGMGPSRVTR